MGRNDADIDMREVARRVLEDNGFRVEVPREVVKWKTETVTREVKVYAPTPKQADNFERRFGFSPKDRDVLAVGTIVPAPQGGQVAVTLPPGGGPAEITFVATPRRFFELGGIREVSAWVDPVNRSGSLEYSQDLVRTGPIVTSPLDTIQRGTALALAWTTRCM